MCHNGGNKDDQKYKLIHMAMVSEIGEGVCQSSVNSLANVRFAPTGAVESMPI